MQHILNQTNLDDISALYSTMFEGDNVTYTCDHGYIFNGTHDITFTATCQNKSWVYDFDESLQCIRKLTLFIRNIVSVPFI